MLTDIRALTADELTAQFQEWGQPAYRVAQLLEWLYVHRVGKWEAMTNLPAALREQLRGQYALHDLELLRQQGGGDDAVKFLWRLDDHSLIESVLLPANPALYGEPSDRHTLCVSTQVGCAYGCKFCASGLAGLKRNLRADEIVNQVLGVELEVQGSKFKVQGSEFRVSNLVIMGMGEPLANYEAVVQALRILNAPWGGGIGARKITISTSGLAPQIRKLAEEPLQFRLAVSLHGATDAVRERIMPVNRKYPLRELAAALEYYQEKKGRMISFEYVLIAGVNDGLEQVKPLAALARRLRAKVNLIPYNRVEGLPWERPALKAQEAFLKALAWEKVPATLRREKGHEIDAACGQLRLRTEREIEGRGSSVEGQE